MKKYIWLLIGLSAFFVYCALSVYFNWQPIPIVLRSRELNTIGTFFGGVLSPIFSFLSILAVLFIFKVEVDNKNEEIRKEKKKLKKKEEEQTIITYLNWIENRTVNLFEIHKFMDNSNGEFSINSLSTLVKHFLGISTGINAYLDNVENAVNVRSISFSFVSYYNDLFSVSAILDLYFITYDYIINSSLSKKYLSIYRTFLNLDIVQLMCLTKSLKVENNSDFKKYLSNLFSQNVSECLKYGFDFIDMGKRYTKFVDEYKLQNIFDFNSIATLMGDEGCTLSSNIPYRSISI